ncbi:unnamed protein product [Cyprideis torosa]|uniref:Uncharacterized protein n=1 Tax=Cyprideis torosa TaxID=163714 RepID=A0A7R8W3X2_9CRUS|nr:unnamed protein product [Cyprideis torosa]CAG0883473.1 unnamed protein product [Cyprideis torosa]
MIFSFVKTELPATRCRVSCHSAMGEGPYLEEGSKYIHLLYLKDAEEREGEGCTKSPSNNVIWTERLVPLEGRFRL